MDITNNITKYNNLEIDDSLSGYLGHVAQQSHNVYQIFRDFIEEIKPKKILEIGTALGGFTQFLKLTVDDLKLDCDIMSFDIYERSWYNDMILSGIDVRVENIFNPEFDDCADYVKEYIKNEGVTLVLCDGCCKIKEYNLFSDMIKVGDFIMAHDYCENSEKFQQEIYKKVWNWHEIEEKDIRECSIKNNLKSYKQDIFDKVVWVCKRKEDE